MLFFSINGFSKTLADRMCEDIVNETIEHCGQFSLDQITYMDRISIELDPDYRNLNEKDRYSFRGERCRNNNNFERIHIIFQKENHEGKPHCAIRKFYRGTDSRDMVLDTVYSGNTLIRLNRQSVEESEAAFEASERLRLDTEQSVTGEVPMGDRHRSTARP